MPNNKPQTNQAILEKVIQKAIDGGWTFQDVKNYKMKCACMERISYDGYEADNKYCSDCGKKIKTYITKPDWYIDGGKILFLWNTKDDGEDSRVKDPEAIIFNHDFAKALWPGEHDAWMDDYSGVYNCKSCGGGYVAGGWSVDKCWEWHLQQMAIAENPLEYLEKNI